MVTYVEGPPTFTYIIFWGLLVIICEWLFFLFSLQIRNNCTGGYTSERTSIKPDENSKSQYWGTVTFTQKSKNSPLEISWSGKSSQLPAFACANAVKVGNEVLISCGTQPMWAVLTANSPPAQSCDIAQCLLRRGSQDGDVSDTWIRLGPIRIYTISPISMKGGKVK